MGLRATRPNANTGAAAPAANTGAAAPTPAATPTPAVTPAPTQNAGTSSNAVVAQTGNSAVAVQNLNSGILENIEGLGNAGNYVTMDGTNFLYKATEQVVDFIDIIVKYGKRYYQWVEEDGENKIFHNSDTKLDDRYKLRFEIHWDEEVSEGEISEAQFHMPTASAMRFIDYVKDLAKAGYGIGNVVTRMTISRQVQKGSTNRYSRAEFTMVGVIDGEDIKEVANGISTVGKK